MIKKGRVGGIDIEIDDGNPHTADIVDISDCPELCAEADEKRLQFLKRHAKSFGYKIVDKDGNEV